MKLNTFYKQGAALALCLTPLFPCFCGEKTWYNT